MRKNINIVVMLFVAFAFLVSCGEPLQSGGDKNALGGSVVVTPGVGVTVGQTLTARYSGSRASLEYQWYRNGVEIFLATGQTYTTFESGEYYCIVTASGFANTLKSNDVNVTGVPLPELAGDVTISPANGVEVGQLLTATYSGGEIPVRYQWYLGHKLIPNATASTFIPIETGIYTVIATVTGFRPKVSNSVLATSASSPLLNGNLHVTPDEAEVGDELTAEYTGTELGDRTYQWYRNGALIKGAVNDTYTPSQTGVYYVNLIITGYQTKTSNLVVVAGISLAELPGDVQITPPNAGIGTELTVTYTGGEGPGTYQWYKNGVFIPGADGTTYTPDSDGIYTVIYTVTGYQPKVSNMVVVSGLPELPGMTFITDSAASVLHISTANVGQQLFAKHDTLPLPGIPEWRWYNHGVAIPGANGTTYTPIVEGVYSVVLTISGYQPKVSNMVAVTVQSLGDLSGNVRIRYHDGVDRNYIFIQTVVNVNITKTITYEGLEGPATYEWYKDGVLVHEGNEYTPTEEGVYYIIITVPGYKPIIRMITVTSPDLSGSVVVRPAIDVTVGAELVATYTGNETGTKSWQWYVNGNPITGATSYEYETLIPGVYHAVLTITGYRPKVSNAVVVTGGMTKLLGDIIITIDNTCDPNISPFCDGLTIVDPVRPLVAEGATICANYDGDDVTPCSVEWNWYFNGLPIDPPEGHDQCITATESGIYMAIATVINDVCNGYLDSHPVVVSGEECVLPPAPFEIEINCVINGICDDLIATLDDTSYDTGEWTWYWSGNVANQAPIEIKTEGPGLTTSQYNPSNEGTGPGVYWVTYKVDTYRTAMSNMVSVTADVLDGNIVIFPQGPFTNTLGNINVTPGILLEAFYCGSPGNCGVGGQSWQWFRGDRHGTPISGGTGSSYMPTTEGRYYVEYYNNGTKFSCYVDVDLDDCLGMKWYEVEDTTFNTLNISNVAFGNGRFVAVGDFPANFFTPGSTTGRQAHIAYSYDAVRWYQVPTLPSNMPTGAPYLYAVAYGGGVFIAGGEGGRMAWSEDGAVWTAVVDSTFGSESIYDITYAEDKGIGAGRFVAVGKDGRMAYSDDAGGTWTTIASPTSDHLHAVAYGGGVFVAGGGNGEILRSTDGVTWASAFDSGIFGTGIYVLDIAYGGNRFVAVGGQGRGLTAGVSIAYSDDGDSWNLVQTWDGDWWQSGALRYGDSRFHAYDTINGVAYGNGMFVVVGSYGKMAYSEDNGESWYYIQVDVEVFSGDSTAFGQLNDQTPQVNAIAFGNILGGRFVAVANHGKISYSRVCP